MMHMLVVYKSEAYVIWNDRLVKQCVVYPGAVLALHHWILTDFWVCGGKDVEGASSLP